MDNTYADSGDSSPHSRDVDSENHSWEDQPPPNYRVKFMCSYNGKIQPRPHDNQLTYVGGDTKILATERTIKFADIMNKLSSLANSDVIFKYQLPGEDLDALISVTNDEDLEHMMVEYDRVCRLSPKPPRLRLFLFPNKNHGCKLGVQPNQQWLADSVNSVPTQVLTDKNPDFVINLPETLVPVADRRVDERSVEEAEIQRQMHQLQRMQIANQEQAVFRKNSDEALARAFHGDYFQNQNVNVQEKTVPAYWHGGYTNTTDTEHPVYVIPPPPPPQAVMYQPPATGMTPVNNQSPPAMYQTATLPVSGQVGQMNPGYYAMQRGQPDGVYREQQVFSAQPKIIGIGVGGETGYTQVAYDSAGRQVRVMPAPYQTIAGTGGVDFRQVAPLNLTQEGINN